MNDKYILKKDHLRPLLRRLSKQCRMVLPVKNKQGDTLFTEVSSLEDCNIDLDNQALASPKQFLLPQVETIFTYSVAKDGGYSFTSVDSAEPTIYFGLRSCDLSAILYMDVILSLIHI